MGNAIYRPKGAAGEYSAWACNFYTGCSNDCQYCYCKQGVMSHVWDTEPHLKKCFRNEEHALRENASKSVDEKPEAKKAPAKKAAPKKAAAKKPAAKKAAKPAEKKAEKA